MTNHTLTVGYVRPHRAPLSGRRPLVPLDRDEQHGETCEWPREYRALSLPLSAYHIGSITLPREMTEAEWKVMTDVLAVMKRAIVPTTESEEITP